jgi:DNA-binding transcriptional MerR regulator
MEHTSSLRDQDHEGNFFAQAAAVSEKSPHDKIPADTKSSLAFRTISEVAAEIDVPQHVLRFWESRFSQLKPLKRGGGRRYYRPEDIELLRRIKNLLYKQGYTIKGVQRLLKENRAMAMQASQQAASPQKNFVPYAHPLANMPSYPIQPVMFSSAALLSAAAAAPSAMAMAYGTVSSTIQKEGQQVREYEQKAERFADALTGAVAHIPDEAEKTTFSRVEQSLDTVTQMRDEIMSGVEPIRVDSNEEALLEVIEAMKAEQAGEPVFDFAADAGVQAEAVIETAQLEAVAEEATVEMEAVPASVEAEVETALQMPVEPVAEIPSDVQLGAVIEAAISETPVEAVAGTPAPAPVVEAVQQQTFLTAELKALMAELIALRDMLNNGEMAA